MFTILGTDNREYGPVSEEVVRQWIAQGRANWQTKVRIPGSDSFKQLGELPEFRGSLAAASGESAAIASGTGAIGTGSADGHRSNGLAVASLVFGVLSFVMLPLLAAIPAIVMGHIALNRIRRGLIGPGGKGQATAGLILGYLNLAFIPLIAIMAALLLPALAKAKGKAQSLSCVNNMKMMGLAARMYANGNNEILPPNFRAMSNELATPKFLVCPADSAHERALDWGTFSETENVTYEFLRPSATTEGSAQQPVFRCPIHNNTALADGSVVQKPCGRGR